MTTTGCAKCTNRWSGLNTAHCPACHETFTSPSAFDKHRTGNHADDTRTCLPPATIGLIKTDRDYPCWGWPGGTDAHSAFLSDQK